MQEATRNRFETSTSERNRPGLVRARAIPRLLLCSIAASVSIAELSILSPRPRPLLLWNASPSSPVGLYWLCPSGELRRGETVVANAPPSAKALAARRGYLPLGVPLVKPVAAIAHDRVCASGADIFINGALAARRLKNDRSGRPLPWWAGCLTVGQDEAFLLSTRVPSAFDGRYFGISRKADMVGKAVLLWQP